MDLYSGFLNVTSTKKVNPPPNSSFHYVFAVNKANVANNPPIAVYISGGPHQGMSSMPAFLMEYGPWIFSDPAPETPYDIVGNNTQSWIGEAHLLFIDMLPGVGFSTSNGSYDSFMSDTQMGTDFALAY